MVSILGSSEVMRKQRGTKIRIVGAKEEIVKVLAALTCQGFTWKSNEHFYPRIDELGFYSYYLENFEQKKASTTVS